MRIHETTSSGGGTAPIMRVTDPGRSRLRDMALRSRDLSADQNARIRAVMRAIIAGGVTQAALAERLGTKQGTIAGFLSGRQGTSMAVAVRLAEVTGIPLSEFGINLMPGDLADENDPYPGRRDLRRTDRWAQLPDSIRIEIEAMSPADRTWPIDKWLTLVQGLEAQLEAKGEATPPILAEQVARKRIA